MKATICVTNDLSFDQRVDRISRSLAASGYSVSAVGRKLPGRVYSDDQNPVEIIRMRCVFNRGFLFYAEFNCRLFFALVQSKPDIVIACDPDTLGPAALYKRWFRKKGIYDSHEYFVETPEIHRRKWLRNFWSAWEKHFAPSMDEFFTVNEDLALILSERLGVRFHTLRNLPHRKLESEQSDAPKEKILIYQGVLNEGRGLEACIDAMDALPDYKLWLAGEGDLSADLRTRAASGKSADRIVFLGALLPNELASYTRKARYGLNLLNGSSKNYFYSLANKFFDYLMAGVPSINMDFPVYRRYCDRYGCGKVLPALNPDALTTLIRTLDKDSGAYAAMVESCRTASRALNWEEEVPVLLERVRLLHR